MQKNSCLAVLVFALLFLLFGASQSFAAWDGKSSEKPVLDTLDKKEFFLIKNEDNLAWFRDSVNNVKGKAMVNAKLMAPLDMGRELFVPIAAGAGATEFAGIFDGNGYTISNLYINGTELTNTENKFCAEAGRDTHCNTQNVGFVAVLGGSGMVKNLNLENVDISASANVGDILGKDNPVTVGTVVAWQTGGIVENCYVSGKVLTSGAGNSIGGLVGNSRTGSMKNNLSTVSILVSGNESYVGGIVGFVRGKVSIEACVYDGNEIINSGNGSSGGIAGYYEKGELAVSRSYYGTGVLKEGVGRIADGLEVVGTFSGVKNVNAPKVVCDLNMGEWDDSSCSQDGSWSIGSAHVVLNGVTRNDNDVVSYAIFFDANGGSFPDGAKTVKYLKPGEKITSDEITNPVHGDTAFAGWALTSDAVKPVADLGTVSASRIVYACWKNVFEITFDANGGSFPNGETTITRYVSDGVEINAAGMELPTEFKSDKDDKTYYFVGWASSSDASKALESLGVASANAVFYAVWTEAPTYSVVFDMQGHGSSVTFVEEGSLVEPVEDPVVAGYTFDGWYTDEEYSKKFNFAKTKITKNTILYAKWSLVEYKISYELGGGENNSGNPEMYTAESATIILKKPSKEGYVFDGWYYDKNKTQAATQITSGSTGDKVVYAKWSVRTYPITYMAGAYGVGLVPADVKMYDVPIQLRGANTYTRENYILDGWSITDGGDKNYDLDAIYEKNFKLTLYPYWIEDALSIKSKKIVAQPGFNVSVRNRSMEVFGLKTGDRISVFDMQGRLVKSLTSQGTSLHIESMNPGTYIVRMDGQFRTVRIR